MVKRVFAVLCVLVVALSFVLVVPVSASETRFNRCIYELDELITESTPDSNLGLYRVRIGDVDARFSPSPFVTRYQYYAGSTSALSYNEYNGSYVPDASRLVYTSQYDYSFNIYPLGATGDVSYYSLISTYDLLKGEVFPWTFHYCFGVVEDATVGGCEWNSFSLSVEILYFDDVGDPIGTFSSVLDSDYKFVNIADDRYAADFGQSSVVFTAIPVDAAFFTYRFVIKHAQPISASSYQMFFGASVYVSASSDYIPPDDTIVEVVPDHWYDVPVPSVPDGSGDISDVIDQNDNIMDSIWGNVDIFDNIYVNFVDVFGEFAVPLTVVVWILSRFMELRVWNNLLTVGLMLGIVTVLLNVSLTIANASRNSKDGKRKGD